MMEAMKMQTTVTAPVDGVVAEVFVHGRRDGRRARTC
jgi:biotin carboxyl carrier protein